MILTRETKVGDLVIKETGNRKGRIGIVTHVYDSTGSAYVILEVLSEGEILNWAEDCCGHN